MYVSPLIRAVQTAETINEAYHVPLITDKRIREMGFGKYEGCHIASTMEKDPNFYNCFHHPEKYIAPDDGEGFQDVLKRIDEFTKQILLPLETENRSTLVVCHGAVIRMFLSLFENRSIKNLWGEPLLNCSVSKVDLTNGIFTVEIDRKIYYEE